MLLRSSMFRNFLRNEMQQTGLTHEAHKQMDSALNRHSISSSVPDGEMRQRSTFNSITDS